MTTKVKDQNEALARRQVLHRLTLHLYPDVVQQQPCVPVEKFGQTFVKWIDR